MHLWKYTFMCHILSQGFVSIIFCILTIITLLMCDEMQQNQLPLWILEPSAHNDFCTAAVIVLYETQFPSSVRAKWEERLLWSITGEEGIIVHDCYVTGSLFHIYCNTGQMLSICARAHCHHLSQSCNYLGFLSAMWKSMLTRVYPQV